MANTYYFASGSKIYSTVAFATPTVIYENTYKIRGFGYKNGMFVLTDFDNKVLKSSTDLVNWNSKALGTYQIFDAVSNINNRWFVRGQDGYPNIFTSVDGINWTTITTSTGIEDIAYFNGYYYYGLAQSSAPYYSSLYRSNNTTSIGVGSEGISGIPYSIATDGTSVAVAGVDYRSAWPTYYNYGYSTNGTTWNTSTNLNNNYSLRYLGNVWVAWKSGASKVVLVSNTVSFSSYTSIDYTSVFGGSNIYQVNYINNRFVIFPLTGNTIAVTQNANLNVNTLTLYNMGVPITYNGTATPPFGLPPTSNTTYLFPSPLDLLFLAKSTGSAPQITAISSTFNGLIVNFNAPADAYPNPTAYYYSISGDIYNGSTYSLANGTASPLTISGLTAATSYSVRLIAQNELGNTAPSAAVSGTPYIVPAAGPTITQITVSPSNQLSISFLPPPAPYHPTTLTYQYSLDGGAFTSSGATSSPIVVPGLVSSKLYSVALNAVASDACGNVWTSPSSTPLNIPCFLEGTLILCEDALTGAPKQVAVESLRPGDRVVTARSGSVPVRHIGHRRIVNPPLDVDTADRMFCYRTSQPGCEGLFQDLFVTGNHCALLYDVDDATLTQVRKHMGDVFVTEGYYRVPACLDHRAAPLDAPHRTVTIWHFALEHDNIYKNYGVYANGLLVESSSIRYMTELSGMQLLSS
jgi:hypothetical protein